MSNIIIYIYNLFHDRRWLFYVLLACSLLFIIAGLYRVRFVEDISGSAEKAGTTRRFDFVVHHFRFAEQLVINLSIADTSAAIGGGDLCLAADSLAAAISAGCRVYIGKLNYKPDDSLVSGLMDCTHDHLPLFLDERDYKALDTMTSAVNIEKAIKKDYHQLVSPASIAIRSQVVKDPLGIEGLALRKLQKLQGSDQYESYNGYILSKDHRHLLIFISPANPPGETGKNGQMLKKLDKILREKINSGQRFRAEYFGAAAVAAGNAERLKKDIILTLAIALLAIFLLLGLYFSSFLVPLLGLFPAVFGGGLAIAIMAFVKGSVSAIAMGIGSVILGLIIDYSLYLINQYRKCKDVKQTLQNMSQSIVVCALTSAGAFLCLVFLESSVLHDLGWFAALSVAGAALFALAFLPQMFPVIVSKFRITRISSFIDSIGSLRFERSIPLIIFIGLVSIASLFYSRRTGFETDMNTLNYMDAGLKKAGDGLDSLSGSKLKNVYVVATGADREEALRLNEQVQARLDRLILDKTVTTVSGVRMLLLSDSLSSKRLKTWEKAFPPKKSREILDEVEKASLKAGFIQGAFGGFSEMLVKSYKPIGKSTRARFENALFSEWLNDHPGMVMVTSLARVKPVNVDKVYREFRSMNSVVVFDRQKLTDNFVERVRRDFSRLVLLSMLFVSLLLWFSFGRIELALFTAIPMYLSWLITLGFMGASGIRFNIFNIIISSFIFGLGVDYSILMMRGMMEDYKYRTRNISTYRVSIILSSATTLFGVAALFTARHPALNSIALISVFGILVLVIITFCLQPLVAGWFMINRINRNKFPITARVFVKTIITWTNIVLIAIILAVAGTLMYYLLPVKKSLKETMFHKMFCSLSRLYIFITFSNRKLYNPFGEDFKKPAVIICNHQSLIETPAMLRLCPKIIILTRTWVHDSIVFGPIARLASFYNVDQGLDPIMDKLKMKVSEGYSILVFPEAHRSVSHDIQRFHRGAFYMAEQLQLDILPVMMFGTGDFLEPGAFWGRPNRFRQRIFKRVAFDDPAYGHNSRERTKSFRQFYIREYERFQAEEGNAGYWRRKLVLNYIYKGPVLEWYLRIKLMLEKNYQLIAGNAPRKGEILDLGCGYGFVSHMLALTSAERKITGIDYDEEKIRVAGGGFLQPPGLIFEAADIRAYEFSPKDCIILSDVLHYIPREDQEKLLLKCMANLRPGGSIIVRDADVDRKTGHSRSRLTEFFSTGMGFNKTYDKNHNLHFFSTEEIERMAVRGACSFEIIGSKTYSSNTYYLLRQGIKTGTDEPL